MALITRSEAHRIMKQREADAAAKARTMNPADLRMEKLYGIRAHEITPLKRPVPVTERQLSVLRDMADRWSTLSPGCGMVIDSWIVPVLDSLARRGLVTKTEQVVGKIYGAYHDGREHFYVRPSWSLNETGREFVAQAKAVRA